jgi:V8-like Glu-specific endopeptidase
MSVEDLLSQVMPAVVLVETPTGRGSAFFVRNDTLLTNVHVVAGNSSVTIRRMDGTSASARVESQSAAYDLALLKVSNPQATQALITLGSLSSVRVGQEVIAIGSALGTLQNTVTRGIVSGLRRTGNATLVQTDAAVNPGNSGGPLLDRNGEVIGITTMGYKDRQGLNFAVGVDHALALLSGKANASSPTSAGGNDQNDLSSLSPAIPSETDRMRTEGQRVYEQTLTELTRRADVLDTEWRRFSDVCYSAPMTGSFDRQWFVLLSPRGLSGPVAQDCGTYVDSLKREAATFGDAMKRAAEDARRAGVYPGILRDTLRKDRLNFDLWGR